MRSTGKDDEKDEKENAERILFSDKSPCSKQVKKGHDMRRKASWDQLDGQHESKQTSLTTWKTMK